MSHRPNIGLMKYIIDVLEITESYNDDGDLIQSESIIYSQLPVARLKNDVKRSSSTSTIGHENTITFESYIIPLDENWIVRFNSNDYRIINLDPDEFSDKVQFTVEAKV